MGEVSKDIEQVEMKDEFRVCPSCGYESGFHASFIAADEGKLRLVLICPSCGARYEIAGLACGQ